MDIHSGSWFGLPDFGITERIGSMLGIPTNYQGGSNIVGSYPMPPSYTQNVAQAQQLAQARQTSPVARTTTSPNAITTTPTIPDNGGGQPAPDPYAGLRNEINSGYDQYFQSLNDQLNNYLPGQVASQQQVVNNSYNQGVTDLGYQKEQGLADLAKSDNQISLNQQKSLRNLDDNLRNMFLAGNVYLGSRGAGDSSAANQYSYALQKLGSQQRGNVISEANQAHLDVADKQYRLGQLYNQEVNRLTTEKDNNLLAITQWFADAQQQVRSAIANGQLSRSADLQSLSRSLLDQALNKIQLAEADARNRRATLESWAMSNASNLAQLKANMQGISTYIAPSLQAPTLTGTPQVDSRGNYTFLPGYSGTTDTKKKLNGLFG